MPETILPQGNAKGKDIRPTSKGLRPVSFKSNEEHAGKRNQTYYFHFNVTGSVIALSDSAGDTAEMYRYDVYGRFAMYAPNGQDRPASLYGNPYLFTGRRFDPETGLYYYRARMYNPHIGRFMQTDPIGYADGINWYAYCGNNPVNLVDPSGEFIGSLVGAAVGGLVGLGSQFAVDVITSVTTGNWHLSSGAEYAGAVVGGAVAGAVMGTTLNPALAGAAAGAASNLVEQGIKIHITHEQVSFSAGDLGRDVMVGAVAGGIASKIRIPGVTKGQGSWAAVSKKAITKMNNQAIRIAAGNAGQSLWNTSGTTLAKMAGVGFVGATPWIGISAAENTISNYSGGFFEDEPGGPYYFTAPKGTK